MKFVPDAQNSFTTITHLNIYPDDKKVKLHPYEVKSFTIDQRYFIATHFSGAQPTRQTWEAGKIGFFVQLTDTGRLWLGRRYRTYGGGGGVMMPGGGGMMAAGASTIPVGGGMMVSVGGVSASGGTRYTWVLRRRNGPWVEIPDPNNHKGTNKKFRQMLAPYFADRPDLLQSLEGERLDYKRVDQAIRGYNSGEPVFFLDHDY